MRPQLPAGLTTTAIPPAAGAHMGAALSLPDAVEPLVANTPTNVFAELLVALALELLITRA